MDLSNPKAIAERGETIYREKYKTEYEKTHLGKFIAIDVATEKAYIGDSPAEALIAARNDAPEGIFHLMKSGSSGAYRMTRTRSNAGVDWIFR